MKNLKRKKSIESKLDEKSSTLSTKKIKTTDLPYFENKLSSSGVPLGIDAFRIFFPRASENDLNLFCRLSPDWRTISSTGIVCLSKSKDRLKEVTSDEILKIFKGLNDAVIEYLFRRISTRSGFRGDLVNLFKKHESTFLKYSKLTSEYIHDYQNWGKNYPLPKTAEEMVDTLNEFIDSLDCQVNRICGFDRNQLNLLSGHYYRLPIEYDDHPTVIFYRKLFFYYSDKVEENLKEMKSLTFTPLFSNETVALPFLVIPSIYDFLPPQSKQSFPLYFAPIQIDKEIYEREFVKFYFTDCDQNSTVVDEVLAEQEKLKIKSNFTLAWNQPLPIREMKYFIEKRNVDGISQLLNLDYVCRFLSRELIIDQVKKCNHKPIIDLFYEKFKIYQETLLVKFLIRAINRSNRDQIKCLLSMSIPNSYFKKLLENNDFISHIKKTGRFRLILDEFVKNLKAASLFECENVFHPGIPIPSNFFKNSSEEKVDPHPVPSLLELSPASLNFTEALCSSPPLFSSSENKEISEEKVDLHPVPSLFALSPASLNFTETLCSSPPLISVSEDEEIPEEKVEPCPVPSLFALSPAFLNFLGVLGSVPPLLSSSENKEIPEEKKIDSSSKTTLPSYSSSTEDTPPPGIQKLSLFVKVKKEPVSYPSTRCSYPAAPELSHPILPAEWRTYMEKIRSTKSKKISKAKNNCDILAAAFAQGTVTGKFIPAESKNKNNSYFFSGMTVERNFRDSKNNQKRYLALTNYYISYGHGTKSKSCLNECIPLKTKKIINVDSEKTEIRPETDFEGFEPPRVEKTQLVSHLQKTAQENGGWALISLGFSRIELLSSTDYTAHSQKIFKKQGHILSAYVVTPEFNKKFGNQLAPSQLITFLEPQAFSKDLSSSECISHSLDEIIDIIQDGKEPHKDTFDKYITLVLLNSHQEMAGKIAIKQESQDDLVSGSGLR